MGEIKRRQKKKTKREKKRKRENYRKRALISAVTY